MKLRKVILTVITSFSLIIGCQPINQNTSSTLDTYTFSSSIETKTTIKGTVEFPSSNELSKIPLTPFTKERTEEITSSSPVTRHSSPFTIQTTLGEIATDATVSILQL